MAREGRFAKGAARREAILSTATEVLARDGYRSTSLRAVARTLGLEPAHILYYFDSREDLLQNVIERWDAEAIASIGGEPAPEDTLDVYVELIRRNLEIPGLIHLYLIFAAEAAQSEHPFAPVLPRSVRAGSPTAQPGDRLRAGRRASSIGRSTQTVPRGR